MWKKRKGRKYQINSIRKCPRAVKSCEFSSSRLCWLWSCGIASGCQRALSAPHPWPCSWTRDCLCFAAWHRGECRGPRRDYGRKGLLCRVCPRQLIPVVPGGQHPEAFRTQNSLGPNSGCHPLHVDSSESGRPPEGCFQWGAAAASLGALL